MNISFAHQWLLSLIFLSILSCEKVIRIEEKNYEQKAVVFATIGEDSIAEVFLTESISNSGWVGNRQQTQFITDAKVEIHDVSSTELLKATSRYDDGYSWGYEDSILIPFYRGEKSHMIGKEYTLSFEYKNQEIKARTTIPSPVHLFEAKSIKINKNDGLYFWTVDGLRVTIQDRAGEANGYRLHVEYNYWDSNRVFDSLAGQYVRQDSVFRTHQTTSGYELDENKDGKNVIIEYTNGLGSWLKKILPDGRTMYYSDIIFQVETADLGLARYFQSIFEQKRGANDPFAEPVFLKSNIENGLGIFGGYSMSDTVHFRYVFHIE